MTQNQVMKNVLHSIICLKLILFIDSVKFNVLINRLLNKIDAFVPVSYEEILLCTFQITFSEFLSVLGLLLPFGYIPKFNSNSPY